MSTRLSRSEREFIVGSYLKGKPVAGYDVIECANGKYRVKAKPFEVESSDEPEPESVKQEPESVQQEPVQQEPVQQESAPHSGSTLTSARGAQSESVKQEPVQQESVQQEESSDEHEPIKQPKPRQRLSKQDARQLLKQLNDMFSDDDDEPQSYTQQPRNWNRRRLKF